MSPMMQGHSQLSFVVLSIIIANLSAYAALDLSGRVASSRSASARYAWLMCGSLAMGIGIWSMHYIGMLGYRMDMPVMYDWPTVLLSMLAAVLSSGLALWIVSGRTLGVAATLLGSLCMGGGIAAMHYIGMAAMRMPAISMYSTPWVVASVVTAVVIAFAALRLTFVHRYEARMFSWSKSLSAVLMGCAIPVMHYMGMAAVSFMPAELAPNSLRHAVSISGLGTASIALVTVLILSLVYLSAFIDRRFMLHAEELQSSEERYRRIVGAAFDAFVGIDSDGMVNDWNDQAEKTFGWTAEEAIGKPVGELLSFDSMDPLEKTSFSELAASNDGRLHGRLEVTAKHKTGMLFPAEMAVSEISVGDRRIFAAFVHDVTERKLAERSMEEARMSAEAANRAKSEFLANMSHEIRTPLNGVIGMTDLALETELTREQREYLTTVKFSADSLLTVINDILDFSKIEAGKVDLESIRFDLRECVETTLKTLALRADEKGLELLCDVAVDLPEVVLGDPGRLRQIIVNLIGNAIKFTAAGEVSLRVASADPSEGADYLQFTVSDTGIGIAPEKLLTIFDSFSQADTSTTRQYGGTGLGLTITKRLTDLMGGRVWCESTPGQGSEFHFTVPLPASKFEVAPVAAAPVALLQGVKVLIVDDNKTNRRILEGLLKLWGMDASSAADGETALHMLEAANAEGVPYRLLLSDMHMPKMDGFMVVQEMRMNSGLSLPTVMMLSSGGHHGDANRCQQLGIAAYLLKPVRRQELQEAIARALGAAHSENNEKMITQSSLLAELPAERFLNILLAEDNEVNQKLAMRMLQKRGHRVVLASNGREAVEATERSRYDLVLMDVQMPEMDGIQATLAIRAREAGTKQHLPIVAMTALVMKGDRERCMAAEMDGYLSKPIRPQELDAVLETYAAKKAEASQANAADAAAVIEAAQPVDAEDLLERIDGDLEFVAELAQTFEQDYPEKMSGIQGALERGDGNALRQVAHGLKGALANLAAVRGTALAAQLESAGASNTLAGTQELVQQLNEELPRVMAALHEICGARV